MVRQEGTISCELHDHIEVACLFGYELDVTLVDGSHVRGRASTTKTALGSESLVLENRSGKCDIPLHEILTISVLTPGARFQELQFRSA